MAWPGILRQSGEHPRVACGSETSRDLGAIVYNSGPIRVEIIRFEGREWKPLIISPCRSVWPT